MMDMHMTQLLQLGISILSSVICMAALALLWSKSKSGWLLLAIGGFGASLLFRLTLAVMPSLYTVSGMLPMLWSATALLEAAGLLGYALEQTSRRE
jgi:hypothetical protein